MAASEEGGFAQNYDLLWRQKLFIYCRLCREIFPVTFRPRSRKVKLKCLCGHEGPISEMDVFRSEEDAKEHASFYERIYSAAKSALAEAGVRMPPSGKYPVLEEEEEEFTSYYDEIEDASAIRDGYIEESDIVEADIVVGLAEFEQRLEKLENPLERHEVLSELVDWSFCRRHLRKEVRQRFRAACREDMDLAKQATQLALQRLKRGETTRLNFSSFKHLVIDLLEVGDEEQALTVLERAAELGLKGYRERAEKLRRKLEKKSS